MFDLFFSITFVNMNELDPLKEQVELLAKQVEKLNSYYENNPEEEEIIYEDSSSAYEVILAANAAIQAVSDIDEALAGAMSKEDGKRIARIKKKSLRMIDWGVGEMYDSIFDNGKEIDQEEE